MSEETVLVATLRLAQRHLSKASGTRGLIRERGDPVGKGLVIGDRQCGCVFKRPKVGGSSIISSTERKQRPSDAFSTGTRSREEMNILNKITCNCSFLSGGGGGGGGGGGTRTDDVQPSSGSVRETARVLATELCLLNPPPTAVRPTGRNAVHVRTMRTLVRELLDRHRIVFDKSVRTVAAEAQDVDEGLRRVVTDMFGDGQVNWGRVVAVYAFAHRLSQHAVEHDMTGVTERIADATARFIEDDLTEWILGQGGWDSFEKHFQQEDTAESKVWTGLLCTFIGLGTLATIKALK